MRLLALLLTILNPSFEQPPVPLNNWNSGPVPGWTLKGVGGLWQPSPTYFSSMPDGKTILWLNKGSATQDLGIIPQQKTTYTVTLQVGRRLDGASSDFHVALSDHRGDPSGTWCVLAGNNGFITPGTWHEFTFSCPIDGSLGPPATDTLWLTIASDGPQVDIDSVSVTQNQ